MVLHPCECLNRCLSNIPTAPVTCDKSNYVSINCTFDISIAKSATQGSSSICGSPETCNGSPWRNGISVSIPGLIGAILILGFLLIVASAVILVVCFMVPACPLAKWGGGGEREAMALSTNKLYIYFLSVYKLEMCV